MAGDKQDDIAIVGMACRFPGGAVNPQAFWTLLEQGFDAITDPPASRTGFTELFDPDPKKPGRTYLRRGGFIEGVDLFDAPFFGLSPRETIHVDPQHRLLLEMVQEACEDAGIPATALAGTRTGVFIGISTHDYGDTQMYPQHRGYIDMHTNSGTATSIAANRISFTYDLRGPSLSIDTACSSALTALHIACQSLRTGDCDTAIAGGVQLLLTPELTIGFSKASMLSRDGECRAFDAAANGYVRSEGSGVVLLKPLRDALDAGDRIYAVIRATSINQDGHTPSMTMPSAAAQQAMIEDALAKAGVAPGDVQYVETHGTGTPVGDPIEATAVGMALSKGRPDGELCAIGSVKTNVGHLEAASGMTGVIKVALSLWHRRIPPSLHFRHPPDAIDLRALRLRVVTESEAWPASNGAVPLAGVNSFGFGGANAHVLLQAAPERTPQRTPEPEIPRLLAISAKTPEALKSFASAYADLLRGEVSLRDICYTASERRAHFDWRLAVTATSREDFAMRLDDFVSGVANANVTSGRVAAGTTPRLAFVFSGMGPQWWGMGRQLRASEPVFRRTLEQCDAALRPHSGWSLLEELSAPEATSRVAAPELAQVTNFAIQVALLDLWASWGIVPDAVIGHSGGAMAAAYAAGVYDLEDAIRLSYHRSRMQGRPSNFGRMLAVGAPFSEIEPLLSCNELAGSEHLVCLAAVNGPTAITLAGDPDTLERILATLQQRSIFARMLTVTIAYHSHAMDGIREEFLTTMRGLKGRKARIPFLSDTTGTWASGEECDEHYWWRAIRQPVLFRDGILALVDSGISNFVEIGPHPVLVSLVLECMKERGAKGVALPSIRRSEDERAVMLRSLGGLYAIGCAPQWSALRDEGAALTDLPHYPWQRERHWFEPKAGAVDRTLRVERKEGDHPLLGARLRCARPVWENALGEGETGWLQEHLVQGSPVYPGAAYVEMALAACRQADPSSPVLLRDVEFLKPLVLKTDEPVHVEFALDPETNRFEVFSSVGPEASGWIGHARGNAASQKARNLPRFDLAAMRERTPNAVPVEEFYTRMAGRSLVYGPVFAGIKELWAGEGEALGYIELANPPDCKGYCVHPALLDAAFQVLVAAAESTPGLVASRRLFLPVQLQEFRFYAPPGERFTGYAVVTGATDSSVTSDLRLIGENGDVCVEVKGLTARLVDTAGHTSRDTIDQWLYDFRWEPAPEDHLLNHKPGHLPSETELAQLIAQADETSAQTGWNLYYTAVESRLNELAAAYVNEASLPAHADGWRQSLSQQLTQIQQRFGKPQASAHELAEALLRDFPGHRLDVELLQRCGPRLADVLAGRADGPDVLFTPEGFAFMEEFYRQSPALTFYNPLAANLVAEFVPARVLEVGAGTGGTSAAILPRLKGCGSYVFTDVSQLFLDRARAKFSAEYPFLSTRLFDVSKDSAGQGFEEGSFDSGSFDLILASNVLHATAEVKPCLERLRRLLAPGGALVLLEITSHPWWLDIVFGLMDGWWKFEDRELRPHHPLMPGRQWQTLLNECGFENAAVLADTAPGEPAQSIIFARRPIESAEAKPWLIFGEGGDVAQRLAHRLTPSVSVTSIDEVHDTDFQGIVFLQADCSAVIPVLQRLVANSPLADRAFIMVTGGAQTPLEGEDPALSQCPIWGLARVLRKEWPNLRSQIIDLSAECTDEEIAALAREIGLPQELSEEEIALRAGQRFVRRLRPVTLARLADAAPGIEARPEEQWHAAISTTGSLDSISLRTSARLDPASDEVEVAIRSVGLNFRDVVIAMGAVANMETEQSLGNRELGLDFAGTVTRCGDAVQHLRPGDEVFGMAKGTLASYILVHVTRLVPRPARITVEQASSIPIAFVTAHYALRHLARLSKGESILIHVASGGVGLAAVQMAKLAGARIFATAGSPAKRSYLESLGVEHVMDSRSLSFADEIAELTAGHGVDVVLNSLSGEAIDLGLSSLAPYGRFIELGKVDIYKNNRLQLFPFRKNLSLFSVDLDRMSFERTEFVGQLLREVTDEFASGVLVPIPYTEFPMSDVAAAMRYMAQAKHIGKVVVTNKTPVKVRPMIPDAPPVRADATYLITGGLGGVGFSTAQWLAERGARSIVLMGRHAPSLEIEGQMAHMRDAGIRIEAMAADVVNPADVESVIEQIRAHFPSLRGIIHAAMVLDDVPLAELTEERWNSVLAPKVEGAWNLHQSTCQDPSKKDNLDFFILFSSITSILGNPFQANYAAANAFLDSFATWRRNRGLAATTINWGVIADSGYVARHPEVEEYLHRQGYMSFTGKQTLEVLSDLMRYDVAQIMAARIDWKRLGDYAPVAAASPHIRHLIPAAAAAHALGSDKGSILAFLAADTPEARTERVEQYLKEQVARLLGASQSAVDPERPIVELGLDSLIAAELTVVIERDFKLEIASTRMLGGTSVRLLARDIIAMLHLDAGEPNQAPSVVRETQELPQPQELPEPQPVLPRVSPVETQTESFAFVYEDWTPAQKAMRKAVTAGRRLLGQIDTEGFDNIPRQGPCLLVVDRLSIAEVPPVLAQLPRRAILLAREQSQQDALAVFKAGGVLAVAPEGGTEVAWLATQADVPVVPLASWGQKVHVRAGAPLRFPQGAASPDTLRLYTDQIMNSLAALLPQEYRGVNADSGQPK